MKILDSIKKRWELIVFFIGAMGFIWNGFKMIDSKLDSVTKSIQMSEKAIIWNDNIPIMERANVCDDYLAQGFNSYTKKYCEKVILKDENIIKGE